METEIEVRGDKKLFHLFLDKQDFKFSCGHFVAYQGYREPLHGHNYHATIAMKGQLNADGYVMDFGDVKKYMRVECKKLNQKFILPMKSDVLIIKENGDNWEITTEDNSFFSFPKKDCYCLPIVHSSAEELARYIVGELINAISLPVLHKRGIYEITVGVSEIEGQEARYTTSVDFSSLYYVCNQTIGLLGISLSEDDHSFAVFMSNCTCITCSAVFDNQEEREKSDWHSYNVKRKIAGLSTLSKELFEERQRHLKATESAGKKQEKQYCEICRKSFASKNSFIQHERSKRHLQGLKKYQDDFQNAAVEEKEEKEESPVEKVTKGHTEPFTPEEYEFEPSRCLFCRLESETFNDNLEHMAAVHCFFIPDNDSVINLEGLIDYLGQKISVGCICLGCNHGFKSPTATRDHMLSKGHTRMAYSTEEDYEEFEEFYDYTEANENPEVTLHTTATGELQLPDGRILGNREYMRYYKQTYSNEGEKRESILNKLLLENGGQGKKSMALMAYEAQKSELTSKRDDVERLNRYAIRERLRAGLNMNKIHLAHFSHR